MNDGLKRGGFPAAGKSLRALMLFDGQAGLHELGFRGAGQTVGLLDSGVVSQAVEPSVAWRDTVTGVADVREKTTHGDHMARVIVDVAPDCRLGVVNVFNRDGLVTRKSIARGFEKAQRREVELINLSLGIRRFDATCTDDQPCVACRSATAAVGEGTFVIAASGNFGEEDATACPGSARDAISVQATDGPSDTSELVGEEPGDTGTSVSSAIVTGGCTLLRSALPDLTVAEFRRAISTTGTSLVRSPETRRAHFFRAFRFLEHVRAGGRTCDEKTGDRMVNEPLQPVAARLGAGPRTLSSLVGAMTPTERAQTRNAFERARGLLPWSATVHLGLGLLDEAEGLARAFTTALEVLRLDWCLAEGHALLSRQLRALGQDGAEVEDQIAHSLDAGDDLAASDMLFAGQARLQRPAL